MANGSGRNTVASGGASVECTHLLGVAIGQSFGVFFRGTFPDFRQLPQQGHSKGRRIFYAPAMYRHATGYYTTQRRKVVAGFNDL
jgi:hypothetical protein